MHFIYLAYSLLCTDLLSPVPVEIQKTKSCRNCCLWHTCSWFVKLSWSKWLQQTKSSQTAPQKGPFCSCFGNRDSGYWQHCFYLSACVESVRTALAALVPHSRLPPRKSKALPLLLSLTSSWIETGWMTGLLLRVVSCSGVSAWGDSPGSESGCSPPGAWGDWVMVREGWETPSLKWVCSSVLMYSHTLRTNRRSKRLIKAPKTTTPPPSISLGSLKKSTGQYFRGESGG